MPVVKYLLKKIETNVASSAQLYFNARDYWHGWN